MRSNIWIIHEKKYNIAVAKLKSINFGEYTIWGDLVVVFFFSLYLLCFELLQYL